MNCRVHYLDWKYKAAGIGFTHAIDTSFARYRCITIALTAPARAKQRVLSVYLKATP